MNTEHTKEPWRLSKYVEGYIIGSDDRRVAVIKPDNDIKKANARRITACVNACAGIPTEALEHTSDCITAESHTISKLKQQRDELLAIIKRIKEWDISNNSLDIPQDIRADMQAALYTKGGAA